MLNIFIWIHKINNRPVFIAFSFFPFFFLLELCSYALPCFKKSGHFLCLQIQNRVLKMFRFRIFNKIRFIDRNLLIVSPKRKKIINPWHSVKRNFAVWFRLSITHHCVFCHSSRFKGIYRISRGENGTAILAWRLDRSLSELIAFHQLFIDIHFAKHTHKSLNS